MTFTLKWLWHLIRHESNMFNCHPISVTRFWSDSGFCQSILELNFSDQRPIMLEEHHLPSNPSQSYWDCTATPHISIYSKEINFLLNTGKTFKHMYCNTEDALNLWGTQFWCHLDLVESWKHILLAILDKRFCQVKTILSSVCCCWYHTINYWYMSL